MNITNNIVKGVFLCELKNRFICKVRIENEQCEAYIPSSSKLSHFINLKNKEVLLTPNLNNNSRTKFTVFAVRYRNKYIMLNPNIANKFFEYKIHEDQRESGSQLYSCIIKETSIEGYKADLYFENYEKTIVENKSIICTKKEALFPTVYSGRSIEQLKKLEQFLDKGYKVIYNFISLSPYIKTIRLNKNQIEYYEQFMKCIKKNMIVNAYSLTYSNGMILDESIRFIESNN